MIIREYDGRFDSVKYIFTVYDLDIYRIRYATVEIDGIKYVPLKVLHAATQQHNSSVVVSNEMLVRAGEDEIKRYVHNELVHELANSLIKQWETE